MTFLRNAPRLSFVAVAAASALGATLCFAAPANAESQNFGLSNGYKIINETGESLTLTAAKQNYDTSWWDVVPPAKIATGNEKTGGAPFEVAYSPSKGDRSYLTYETDSGYEIRIVADQYRAHPTVKEIKDHSKCLVPGNLVSCEVTKNTRVGSQTVFTLRPASPGAATSNTSTDAASDSGLVTQSDDVEAMARYNGYYIDNQINETLTIEGEPIQEFGNGWGKTPPTSLQQPGQEYFEVKLKPGAGDSSIFSYKSPEGDTVLMFADQLKSIVSERIHDGSWCGATGKLRCWVTDNTVRGGTTILHIGYKN